MASLSDRQCEDNVHRKCLGEKNSYDIKRISKNTP